MAGRSGHPLQNDSTDAGAVTPAGMRQAMNDDDKSGTESGGRMRRQRRRDRASSGRGGGDGTRLKRAKGRTESSKRWLERQLSDPYVAAAQREGYRARAAYKLREIDDKHRFLTPGARVVDLGAAPGSWCQVALERIGDEGRVVGIDLLEVTPLVGVTLLQGDMTDPGTPARVQAALDGPANVVLSDMAPNMTGQKRIDQLRVIATVEAALDFAEQVLCPGGAFLAKTLQSGSAQDLVARLKREFDKVRHVKPPSSRSESAETYVLATGFKGVPGDD
jgi:23S rRNA (uridine2552-2'-O)-methyltransferase